MRIFSEVLVVTIGLLLLTANIEANNGNGNGGGKGGGKDNGSQTGTDCIIQLDTSPIGWPQDPPIVTNVTTGEPIFPSGREDTLTRQILVLNGDTVKLACSESNLELFPAEGSYFEAQCVGDTQFSLTTDAGANLGTFDFVQFKCARQPNSHSEAYGSKCGPNTEGIIIEIGFSIQSGFLTTLNLCFDQAQSRSIYAYHSLPREIVAADSGNDRPSFRTDGYFPFDVNQMYTQAQQDVTLGQLTGGLDYVEPGTNHYLARGHLSPNADFVFYSWQDATFYFTNVAPQWQVFNGQNWFYLEDGVRGFVDTRVLDLVVYTGTSDVLQLTHANGTKVDIWLYSDSQLGQRLPVPKFFWKVLHDPNANTAVAFVGVNNPYLLTEEVAAHKICPTLDNHPIMDNIYYPDDITRGVTYACEYADARASIPEIPDLGNNIGLLS